MSHPVMVLAILAALPETPIRFREAALPFRFESGSRGRHDLVEIMGGGIALIDYDGDGRLDVFLCQGGPIVADASKPDPTCRLYRNEGNRRFTDVTAITNAPGPSYAMGAAVGDYNGDGRDDLLVTGWRGLRLYRNLGGRFEDVTDKAGAASDRWTTSAAFADLDGDGDLDLYVAAYVDFDPETAPYTAAPDGKRDYPGPEDFSAQPDHLFRNNGDGTFTDVAKAAGVALPGGRGLGVLAADLDDDGRIDIHIANDGSPAWLFRNLGGWKFEEIGMKAGVALDGRGEPLAGMGLARGDVDADGRLDLVATNFFGRSTILFRNEGLGRFADASEAVGIAAGTRSVLGFGVALVDFDGDGLPELLQANGHVLDRVRLGVPFAMKPTLMRNLGGRFRVEPLLDRTMLGRGLVVGDLDDDGRPDAVLASLDAPPTILWNETKRPPGLILDLPTGARIQTKIAGRTVVQEVVGGGSYLSAPDRRLFLGATTEPIHVKWPSGAARTYAAPPPGRPTRWRERESPRR